MNRNGFTLIELLIVVAILSILASIAVPNYRDATIKSRVTKVKMDLRAISGALQTYRIDRNIYPRKDNDMLFFVDYLLPDLTTPVAYLTQANVKDPFGPVAEYQEPMPPERVEDDFLSAGSMPVLKNSYSYTPYINFARMHGLQSLRKEAFALASMGPDQMDSFIVDIPFPEFYRYPGDSIHDSIYNPSNGVISPGDIGYFGGDIPVVGLVGG
ncbi:MAG: prepilin-type N-terminal cleavage/methylation domain-containing protein [Candidatus Omnitrophica bacterium]|nr:prepilin-type N-terminal cleavage/methylation domain-containing protein [Candidatus Omnitrophota bacterium]